MASKELIGRLAVFDDCKAYRHSEAVYYMSRNLPGALSDEFREDISEYWMVWDGGGLHDVEGANKVVKEYAELLNSGEPLEDYPVSVTDYYSHCIGERSYISEPKAINIEICDPSTERGAARWQEINSQNQGRF